MFMQNISDVLYRVKRGLVGYVSYLAACEMNQSFSEYILYEPTLRILTACSFSVRCEVPCPGIVKKGAGDFKKLDFVAEGGEQFALELKWARKSLINVDGDVNKLKKYIAATPNARGFLCVFGRRSHIENIEFKALTLSEKGKPVFADFGITRFGCRVFEVFSE